MEAGFFVVNSVDNLLGVDGSIGGVVLDELAAWSHVLAHEHREDAVGLGSVADVHALKQAALRIHCGFPQLLGVHLSKSFESLHAHVLLLATSILVDELAHLHVGPAILHVVALDGTVQGWRGDVEVAIVDDGTHAAVEECHE